MKTPTSATLNSDLRIALGSAPCERNLRRFQGFTLLELLVVLALLGSLVALVPVAYDRLTASMSYKDALTSIRSGLQTARHQAMSQGSDVSFFIDVNRRTFALEGQAMRQLPANVEVRATVAETQLSADGIASVRFLASGSATGGSIDVARRSGQGTRLKVDWLTGRVSQEALQP